jgi:hypothetical protein
MQTETTRRLSDVTAAQALIIMAGTLFVAFILSVSALLVFPSQVMAALESVAKANPAYAQANAEAQIIKVFPVSDPYNPDNPKLSMRYNGQLEIIALPDGTYAAGLRYIVNGTPQDRYSSYSELSDWVEGIDIDGDGIKSEDASYGTLYISEIYGTVFTLDVSVTRSTVVRANIMYTNSTSGHQYFWSMWEEGVWTDNYGNQVNN